MAERELETDVRRTLLAVLWGGSGEAPSVYDGMVGEEGLVASFGAADRLSAWLSETDLDHFVKQFESSGFAARRGADSRRARTPDPAGGDPQRDRDQNDRPTGEDSAPAGCTAAGMEQLQKRADVEQSAQRHRGPCLGRGTRTSSWLGRSCARSGTCSCGTHAVGPIASGPPAALAHDQVSNPLARSRSRSPCNPTGPPRSK